MKRSGRERLEPYFRLHREAHLNIIRNWMGTNTEPQFYDLADEYGMMVLNDFWQYYRTVLSDGKQRVEQLLDEEQRKKFERLLQQQQPH